MANKTGKSIPDEAKRRRGTDQPSRMRPNAPQSPRDEITEPPSFIKGRAQIAYYRKLATALVTAGIAQDLDRPALGRLVHLQIAYNELHDEIDKQPIMVTVDGAQLPNAKRITLDNHLSKMIMEMRRLETEFGMTPSSRQRIEAEPAPSGGRFDGVKGNGKLRRVK